MLTTGPPTSSHVETGPMANAAMGQAKGVQNAVIHLKGATPAATTVKANRSATASPVSAAVSPVSAAGRPARPGTAARSKVAPNRATRPRAATPAMATVRVGRGAIPNRAASAETAMTVVSAAVVALAVRAAAPAESSPPHRSGFRSAPLGQVTLRTLHAFIERIAIHPLRHPR